MPQETNNPPPSSPSLQFPNLGNVITTDDVSQKGTGSYKADYVNWCRTMHLLHDHAQGWQFHLTYYVDNSHVWKAPNGTAYVLGYFTGPNGERTPDFPQAIMDNRNNAIAYEKVSARDLTDSHRRCLCTAAAAQFGLAWQLWAREEVENPHRGESAPAASTPAAKIDGVAKPSDAITKAVATECLNEAQKQLTDAQLARFCEGFRRHFNLDANAKLSGTFTAVKHQQWMLENLQSYKKDDK